MGAAKAAKKERKERIMHIEKIVGTSFAIPEIEKSIGHAVSLDDFYSTQPVVVNEYGAPTKVVPAQIVTEPENPYDPFALAVYVPLINKQFVLIGHISKDSIIRAKYIESSQTFIETLNKHYTCNVLIEAYSKIKNMNDCYTIIINNSHL